MHSPPCKALLSKLASSACLNYAVYWGLAHRFCRFENDTSKMLSQLVVTETGLPRPDIGIRWRKGFMEPLPQISVNKQVHPQEVDEIGEGPVGLSSELKVFQQEHRNQCCPNLNPYGVGRCTDE